ncbi:MAG: WD40 repeat domain-containing protein [Planctomycetes bacterium]|nr:WD40 repeat domain-containing protein [Planctomycetota bacterium]
MDIGLKDGYRASIVAEGLNNPSFITFRPGDGALTIVDSGNGRVVVAEGDTLKPVVEGMHTEYWKTLEDGTKAFKVGPLAALWRDTDHLLVTDAGVGDGDETVQTWQISTSGPEHNVISARTNPIGPTTDDPKDKGEGNLTGMAMMPDGDTFYVCGQGSDAKTWVLKGSVKDNKLETAFSADDNGIDVNSPMQALAWRGNLLVIYSGAGGKPDGLAVEWDLKTGKPAHQWKLTGLVDPMGIAPLPGSINEFAVVDNNWALTGVNAGKLAVVTLQSDKTEAKVDVIASYLHGPVNCAFGPDKRLYIACLGEAYDSDKGLVVAVDGFSK